MPEASIGDGIVPSTGANVLESAPPDFIQQLRNLIREEMADAVADVERRLGQVREIERANASGVPRETLHAEDINMSKHVLEGYVVNTHTPATGSISWTALKVVFEGIEYTISDGSTPNKYVWFVKPGTYTPGTPMALNTGNTVPVLSTKDCIVFINEGGIPRLPDAGVSYALGNNTVGDAQVTGGIAQSKITNLSTTLTTINSDISRVEAKADGAITQWFGPDFPWANGSSQDAAKTGDVYTAQNTTDATNRPNGRSWKWSGPSGSPANTWILIEDSDLSKALADSAAAKQLAEGKTTVYYRTVAQGAPTPLAPATAFATGDEWVQTDNGNYTQRWNGTGWVPALVGDAAIATGISGAKIGSGISPTNLTGTGTVPIAAVPTLTPTKLNTAFHMIY